MIALFLVLIIITCAVLAFFVLIQNPKGGGLAGSFGGLGNQMMGAKQSTDIVEKGTWVAASILLALTLLSFVLRGDKTTAKGEKTRSEKMNVGVQQAPAAAMPNTAAPAPEGQQAVPAPAEGQAAPAETPAPATK